MTQDLMVRAKASGYIERELMHRYLLARELCRDADVLEIATGGRDGSSIIAETARSVVAATEPGLVMRPHRGSGSDETVDLLPAQPWALPVADDAFDRVVWFDSSCVGQGLKD